MTHGSDISPHMLRKLEKKCNRYQNSCQNLHKRVEELEQEVEHLKGEQQKEHGEYLKHQEQKDKKHGEQIQALKDRVKTHEELQERLMKMKGDLEQNKDQIEILRSNTSELTDSCQRKDSTIERLSRVVREKDCRIRIVQNALQNTDDILKKSFEELEWYEHDIMKYKLEVDRVKDLNAILFEENTQMKHKVEQYQVRVVEFKNTCRDMVRKDQASVDQISKLETQVTQLKVEIYDKANNTNDISLTFHTYENALRDKDEENIMQKDMVKDRDVFIDELKCQIKNLNGEQQKEHGEYLKHQEQKDKKHGEQIQALKDRVKTHEELQERLMEMKEENTQMKHKVEQYQVRVVEFKNTCRDMVRKDQASVDQISKLETQVTQLKVEIYDKANNTNDISLTFHTYENALRDKDEENIMQKDMVKDRDVFIDELKCQIKNLNERMSGLNKHIVEQEEDVQLLRRTVYERDQELDQERSLVTDYSAKYNTALEAFTHISLQLTNCYNETAALQQSAIAKDALLLEDEREQLRLTTELQVVGQAMKDLELEKEQINDEMLKWKKGHSFLQELREKHELLLKRRENEVHDLKHIVQEEKMKVTQMNSEITRLSDDLSSCQDQNVNFRNTVAELKESCDESAMKINELDMVIEERDGIITSKRSEYTTLTEGHIQLLYTHERLSCECETYTRTIRDLGDQLKQAQEELNTDKEAYTFCTSFQQYIHASRLNRDNEEDVSFRTRLPGEEYSEMLEKNILELKDNLATVTLEASNRQIHVREKNEEIKQLRTQLYGYKDRVFELQRLNAEKRLSSGD